MKEHPVQKDDLAFEMALGRLLRMGVLASSICLGAGLLMTLANASDALAAAMLTGGLVLLIATPAARVVASAVSYARRRDWVFVGLTLAVCVELLASVVVALRGSRW